MLSAHFYTVGMMVAHPDDEVLWAGGTLLLRRDWRCNIFTLCRAGDPDRAPRFARILAHLGAAGRMADLDDGPEQRPLPPARLRQALLDLAGGRTFDILITHGPHGEYTRHRRHDETSRAVAELWAAGKLHARELWLFSYDDGARAHLPLARPDAEIAISLPYAIWEEKYHLLRTVYGFARESWEARATPTTEAFRRFSSPEALRRWLSSGEEL